ncbi:MAG: hypothetical protein CW346_09380 [Bacillaceae bacterium]|nr:hypothetical protein [Bacillaceae bacterium]
MPAESATGRSLRAKKRLLPKTPPRLSPHHPRQSPEKVLFRKTPPAPRPQAALSEAPIKR